VGGDCGAVSGTTTGFYFLWLEFYTTSLIWPSLSGLVVTLLLGVMDTTPEVISGLTVENAILFM